MNNIDNNISGSLVKCCEISLNTMIKNRIGFSFYTEFLIKNIICHTLSKNILGTVIRDSYLFTRFRHRWANLKIRNTWAPFISNIVENPETLLTT